MSFTGLRKELEPLQNITKIAYQAGYEAGYRAKEKELKDKLDKEIEEQYQSNLEEANEDEAKISQVSEDYPLGGNLESYDIEKEKEMLKNESA